jgi:hypothetical protein
MICAASLRRLKVARPLLRCKTCKPQAFIAVAQIRKQELLLDKRSSYWHTLLWLRVLYRCQRTQPHCVKIRQHQARKHVVRRLIELKELLKVPILYTLCNLNGLRQPFAPLGICIAYLANLVYDSLPRKGATSCGDDLVAIHLDFMF